MDLNGREWTSKQAHNFECRQRIMNEMAKELSKSVEEGGTNPDDNDDKTGVQVSVEAAPPDDVKVLTALGGLGSFRTSPGRLGA